jgi:hypothetical protein
MTVQEGQPDTPITPGFFVEPVQAQCAGCVRPRLLSTKVCEVVELMDSPNIPKIRENVVGYIALCSREAPLEAQDDDPCCKMIEVMKCQFDELAGMDDDQLIEKAYELVDM